jgi:hypothetical protein
VRRPDKPLTGSVRAASETCSACAEGEPRSNCLVSFAAKDLPSIMKDAIPTVWTFGLILVLAAVLLR